VSIIRWRRVEPGYAVGLALKMSVSNLRKFALALSNALFVESIRHESNNEIDI
jgi:hypothetical protein